MLGLPHGGHAPLPREAPVSGPIYSTGRRDESEAAVIRALRAGGATVYQLSARDVPDLLVGYRGVTRLVEVKTDRAKLRPGQAAFALRWLGAPPVVCRTAPQAVALLRKWETESQETRISFPVTEHMNSWDEGWSTTAPQTSGSGPPRPDLERNAPKATQARKRGSRGR